MNDIVVRSAQVAQPHSGVTMDEGEVNGYREDTPAVANAEENKLEKKYRYFILEPAVLLLFYAWNVSCKFEICSLT